MSDVWLYCGGGGGEYIWYANMHTMHTHETKSANSAAAYCVLILMHYETRFWNDRYIFNSYIKLPIAVAYNVRCPFAFRAQSNEQFTRQQHIYIYICETLCWWTFWCQQIHSCCWKRMYCVRELYSRLWVRCPMYKRTEYIGRIDASTTRLPDTHIRT